MGNFFTINRCLQFKCVSVGLVYKICIIYMFSFKNIIHTHLNKINKKNATFLLISISTCFYARANSNSTNLTQLAMSMAG